MANIILFDSEVRSHLLPLTYLRPVGELRVGILSIREKWEHWMGAKASYITEDYLSDRYPLDIREENLVINASVLPNGSLCRLLRNMEPNEAYLYQDELIAARLDRKQLYKLIRDEELDALHALPLQDIELQKISQLSDLVALNGPALESDFHLLTAGKKSQPLSPSNRVLGPERIFVEEGAIVEGATLNARTGPIYIGAHAEIMEGASLRGPVALSAHAVVRMGAQLYGPVSLGPWSKVGGELDHCTFQGYSNKAHHGFLGNSYIGEWCNIGAGTTVSNLRN
ncbi:MAG: putative sugar nucleotidyl transferase, partial [Haliscomenobacter sp.]